MNFDAKLPVLPVCKLQPATIKGICIDQMQGLDLVNSEEDREEFRKQVCYQLDAYYVKSVRYAISVMGGTNANRGTSREARLRIANAWISKIMREAM